jgi:hypothetical protein
MAQFDGYLTENEDDVAPPRLSGALNAWTKTQKGDTRFGVATLHV